MPELPEIECVVRSLREVLNEASIGGIRFFRSDLRWPVPISEISSYCTNSPVHSITRVAKYILINLGQGSLILHLGMSGNVFSKTSSTPCVPHTHAIFEVKKMDGNNVFLHFVDPRRFGAILFCTKRQLTLFPLFKHLGPDPLTAANLSSMLFEKSRGKKIAIKAFIMNSKNLVGVGNIYANESLFLARINPKRFASNLDFVEWEELTSCIKKTLTEAILAGGTTLKDYRTISGENGLFKNRLLVYGRKNMACKVCASTLTDTHLGGRATYFCPQCQAF